MFLGILMPSVISVHFSQLVDQSVTYAYTSLHYQTYSCQDISQVSWGDTNGEAVDHECNLGSTQNRVSEHHYACDTKYHKRCNDPTWCKSMWRLGC